METRITATELARNLSDILNRARYRGEKFIVERNGEVVAKIEPPPKVTTFREFLEMYDKLPPVDDQFADDLEAIHNAQGELALRS